MNIIEVKDYDEMSHVAAEYMIKKIKENPFVKLGLATGETPVGTYKKLIRDHEMNRTSYRNIKTFNLDEYVGLSPENKNSYRYFMNNLLFNHIDILAENTHIPRGDAHDLQQECESYELLISENGIDLQILGIGNNGHIGFNEPGTSFHSKTHIVNLAPSTINANARFFEKVEEVPTKAITMGISSIMKSKEILLLVSGEKKKDALKKLFNGVITEDFPASVLKNHEKVTVIADKMALSGA